MKGLALMVSTLVAAALVTPVCCGCTPSETVSDVRAAMLRTARTTDEFPDERNEMLTQFADIGAVETKAGPIRVVSCRSVLTGMPAPRGNTWLQFFDSRNYPIARLPLDPKAPPLGCDGSKVFFFGVQSDGESAGNALELADGVHSMRLVFSERVGSWTP